MIWLSCTTTAPTGTSSCRAASCASSRATRIHFSAASRIRSILPVKVVHGGREVLFKDHLDGIGSVLPALLKRLAVCRLHTTQYIFHQVSDLLFVRANADAQPRKVQGT